MAGIYLALLLESLNPINNLLIFRKAVSNILITLPSAFNCIIFFLSHCIEVTNSSVQLNYLEMR